MSKYRQKLPQLDGSIFLSDGGIETTLIFHEGIELPYFAAFDLLRSADGKAQLRNYFVKYASIARRDAVGFIFESPTWRASRDWAEKLGYSAEALAVVNQEAIELMEQLRREYETPESRMVISGCVGPRGDGYDPGQIMHVDEAEAYHAEQIGSFACADADMISAITMTNVPEAIGIVRAAKKAAMPVVISFTVETDGLLPTGQELGDAIAEVDRATDNPPVYYMLNCAHPTHFADKLTGTEPWTKRLRGLRANASRCSHAELNEATELDAGDPAQLAVEYAELIQRLGHINVLGGCCGTDHRHIEQISTACRLAPAA